MTDQHVQALRRPRFAPGDRAFRLPVPWPAAFVAMLSVDLFYGQPLWIVEAKMPGADYWALARSQWGQRVHDVRLFTMRIMSQAGAEQIVELEREHTALFARPLHRKELLQLPFIPRSARREHARIAVAS